jgi:ankyrin repeat protein
MEAVSMENIEIIKELLKHPLINVNKEDDTGDTPLMEAVDRGLIEAAKELLKHPDIDVNIQNIHQETALIKAVKSRYAGIDVIKELLAHPDIDVDIKDDSGKKAIDYANDKNIKELIEESEDPNEVVDDVGKTKLMIAGITEAIRLLQHPKIDTNIQDNFGNSALALATEYGDLEKIELLLANQKTNVNIMNKRDKGSTAIHMIVEHIIFVSIDYKKDRITRIIQAYKKRQDFEIDAVDENGDTVLIRLISLFDLLGDFSLKRTTNKILETVKLFIEEGANPTLPNNKGDTIINLSARFPPSLRDEIQSLYATYLSKQ